MDTVSIIIVCYNAEDFLAGAIDSALAQTYPAVEVVVVDDASTDGTAQIIAGYGDRVRALRLPVNGGAPHARNRGIEVARGAWLLFLDADDFISSDAVEGLMDAARGAPGSLVACPWEFRIRTEDGWMPYVAERPLAPVGDPLEGWLLGHWAPPCAVLHPRAVLLAAGGFDETLRHNDDGDMVMRAFAGGAGLVRATRGTGYYRRHQGTRVSVSTDNSSARALWSQVRVFDKLVAQLAAQGRLEHYRPLIETRYGHIAMQAFESGEHEVARACLQHGGEGAAAVARSPSLPGRLLTAAVGLERKHRITYVLRRWRTALRGRR